MSLLDFLDDLREKPEHVRFQVTLVVAGVVTGIIALVWLSVLSVRLSERTTSVEEETSQSPAVSEESTFTTIRDTVRKRFSEIKTSFEDLREGLPEFEYEVAPRE